MLTALGHGQRITSSRRKRLTGLHATTTETVPAAAVFGARAEAFVALKANGGPDGFDYMFDGAGLPFDDNAFDHLGELGAALRESQPVGDGLPAILTYFGQFIDHDITAIATPDIVSPAPLLPPDLRIAEHPLVLNDRDNMREGVVNERLGSMRLDSLYGDDSDDAPISSPSIERLLRVGAELRTGADGIDLPRYGALFDAGLLTEADIGEIREHFGNIDTRKLAFVGDSRNDENLIVAQLHLAFLRFHNRLAGLAEGSDEDRFRAARAQVRRHYQWFVVNRYLRPLCDAATLDAVIASEATRYRRFAAQARHPFALPFEFSGAAFRFGHSMVRARYDFNGTFRQATLDQLFEFTGRGGMGGDEVLPTIWKIDWTNFLTADANGARRIDPLLARGLDNMRNESPASLTNLAVRNLRHGYVANLPVAQTILAQLQADGVTIDALDRAVLRAGPGGEVLERLGYLEATPLWFYVLAEAGHAAAQGSPGLGPLGTLIVAETLVGLLVNDPESYWHIAGSGDDGRWHPRDAGLPGDPIDDFEKLLRFAGVHPA